MGDMYKEILVKRSAGPLDWLKKAGLIGVTILLFAAGFMIMPVLNFAGLLMVVACYFLLPRLNVEYEYLYVNGDIDIDKIMNREKRKQVDSLVLNNMELAAPSNSHELDHFRSKPGVINRDYTSLDPGKQNWTMVFNEEKGTKLVKLELDEDVIADLRRRAPRKVVQY